MYREVAVLSTLTNWTQEEILGLDHAERERWIRHVTEVQETR